jgi:hypothetical protein
MEEPPFKCLFCLRSNVSFVSVEHPIPESLGNDDWTIPPGFVCDDCNNYFGAKIEKEVISEPPFILERLGYVVKSKKGKVPTYKARQGLNLVSSGFKDLVLLHAEDKYVKYYHSTLHRKPFVINAPKHTAFNISRFLLKMGLEMLLATANIDPYSTIFDNARNYARHGNGSEKNQWQVGYAFYPKREDLEISTRYDEFGPIVKRQLYEYGIGVLPSGDISMSFVYGQHIFACNISRPSIVEHLILFNLHNNFTMQFYRDEPNQKIIV